MRIIQTNEERRKKVAEKSSRHYYKYLNRERQKGRERYQTRKHLDICGIYKIINITNGKYYVGSSCFINERWKGHQRKLNSNCHVNSHLQYSWNKYGENSFEFRIVEKTSQNNLLKLEQQYLDTAKLEKNNVYNTSFIAAGGCIWKNGINPMKGKHHSEKTKRQWSEKRKGNGSFHADKTPHTFKNLITNEFFVGTRCDLHYKHNVDYAGLSRLVNGERKQYCQWSLVL